MLVPIHHGRHPHAGVFRPWRPPSASFATGACRGQSRLGPFLNQPPLKLRQRRKETVWLVERALEHDKPTLRLQLACDELRRERIVRPGLTRLERLVATARQQAHEETFCRLGALLTVERHTWLDGLLRPDPETGRTMLQ